MTAMSQPKSGDVYRRGKVRRHVIGPMEVCGEMGVLFYLRPQSRKLRWQCIDHWRHWASKAQLVERAK